MQSMLDGWAANRRVARALTVSALLFSPAASLGAAPPALTPVPVHELRLENGMTFLLVHRPGASMAAAGWVAHVGSADEPPGLSGVSHLIEHLLFKGSRSIGTRDPARELQLMNQQERIQETIRELHRWQPPPQDRLAPADSGQLAKLERQLERLLSQQRLLMVKGEYARIYTEAGALGINALTEKDFTLYYLLVPANKLELWFWMESDRLSNPVFRDFHAEHQVIDEERLQRVAATPTGALDERLQALLWQRHPYARPISGSSAELRQVSRKQAQEYFFHHYRPSNLTAAIVGDFDPDEVEALARAYFGRLRGGDSDHPEVSRQETSKSAERRMMVNCDCAAQTKIFYSTVAFGHPDSYALDVVAGVLNGRSGRLYRSLVLQQGLAFSAFTRHNPLKRGGSFSFIAEAKGSSTPQQLESAWDRELHQLQQILVPEAELRKVKNQILADAFRRLESPLSLMLRLLVYDGLGDWTYIDRWPAQALAVSAEDIRRVARAYFRTDNRAVGFYHRQTEGPAKGQAPPSGG